MKVGLEANTKRTKYIVMCRHENTGQNRSLLIYYTSFENVEKFRY